MLIDDMTEGNSFFSLASLFDEVEITKNWSSVFIELNMLDKSGRLDPLPDWLAIEIVWASVQFKQELLHVKQSTQKRNIKKALDFLKKLSCWRNVVDFDKHFPLLDKNYLELQGVVSSSMYLSQFLALPKSKELFPHRLFNIHYYKLLQKLDGNIHHPLVHFFRHSNSYQQNSINPNPYFDVDWYRQSYLSGYEHQHPLLHYLRHFRILDVQPSPCFYNKFIRETQGLTSNVEPLSYYLTEVSRLSVSFYCQGFSPCPYFDRKSYLARYADMKAGAENGKFEPFQHFSNWGIKEGRQAHPWLKHDMFAPAMLPSFKAKNRVAILVLGMHRSGTSALTRLINLLGADLPSHLMEANFANPTGYWESDELAKKYHDQILATFASCWDDIFPIAEHHRHSEDWERYRVALAHYVIKEFGQSDCFVLKDPRMCKLIPLWLDVLADLNVRIKVVIPFRNPLEVAESLKARDGFPQEKSFLLWLRHVLDAELYTRGMSRCFVDYKDVLANPHKVVDNIAAQCGISWSNDWDTVGAQITEFIDPQYHHQQADSDCLCEVGGYWVLPAYEVLKQLSELSYDAEICESKLNNISEAITAADSLHGKLIARQQANLQSLNKAYQQKWLKIEQILSQNDDLMPY